MNVLLLFYAMIAGLTGITAGPSTIARAQEVAQGRAVAQAAIAASSQVEIAVHAFALRQASAPVIPQPVLADARRVAASSSDFKLVAGTRAAPERRRE